jgi:phosphate acetyltransferase
MKRVKSDYRIVFVEGEDERILQASSIISKQRIARIILLGNIDKIISKIQSLKLRFNVSIIDPKTAVEKEFYAQKLYGLRRKKGLKIKDAEKLVNNPNYFACMMLYCGDCDAVLSGAVYSTPEMLRPAFQIIKPEKNVKKASGAILLKVKEKEYLFADCSVQENPGAEDLAEIAKLSAKSFEKIIGKKSRIAMLSYHTRSPGGNSEFFGKVRKAAEIAKKSGLNVEGEIQLDAAIDKRTALRKNVKFIDANVLIFPNLDAGNIGYKLVKILASAKMTGVIIQGLSKPVNNLSRGCSADDIVNLAEATVKQLG